MTQLAPSPQRVLRDAEEFSRPSHRPSHDEVTAHYNRAARCVLGVLVDPVDADEVLAFVAKTARTGGHAIVATPNVNELVRGRRTPGWRRSMLASSLSTPDGMPIVWIARLLGVHLRGRVTGADLFEAMERGAAGALRVVLFGGEQGIAARACEQIRIRGGALDVVGTIEPGFGSVEDLGRPELLRAVNQLDPDLVVLSLGQKGKPWMSDHAHKISRGVVAHFGAAINFSAGTVRRAPNAFRRCGLEWLWRIGQEPALWRRYLPDALLLGRAVVTQLLPLLADRIRAKLSRPRRPGRATLATGTTSTFIVVDGPLDHALIGRLRDLMIDAADRDRDVLIDLSKADTLDPEGAALLMLAEGMQHRLGRRFSIINASAAIRRRLVWHGCGDLLPAAARVPASRPASRRPAPDAGDLITPLSALKQGTKAALAGSD